LLFSAEPDQLSLIGVHHQPVAAHPGIDLLDARSEALSNGRCRHGRSADVHLSVIGVRVADEAGTRDDVKQLRSV